MINFYVGRIAPATGDGHTTDILGLANPHGVLELRVEPWNSNWRPGAKPRRRTEWIFNGDATAKRTTWSLSADVGAVEFEVEPCSQTGKELTTDTRGICEARASQVDGEQHVTIHYVFRQKHGSQ